MSKRNIQSSDLPSSVVSASTVASVTLQGKGYTTDLGPSIQSAFDGGAIHVIIEGSVLINTPIFLDKSINTITGKNQDLQEIIEHRGTGMIILGTGLPTCPQAPDTTTKWAIFPNTLRSAYSSGANTVTCSNATAVNGGTQATAPRLILRSWMCDGGGDPSFVNAQNSGIAFGNECAIQDEFCRLRAGKFIKSWVGYSDGNSSYKAWIHNTRGAENLGTTQSVGSLTSSLSTSSAITSLPITLTQMVRKGQTVTLSESSNTQTFTANATALAGATSLAVNSITPNFAYDSGATSASVVIFGCWGTYQQTNGDNVLIDTFETGGYAGAWYDSYGGGGTVRGCIGSAFVFNNTKVTFEGGGHFELPDTAVILPCIIANCADVIVRGAEWFPAFVAGGWFMLVNDSSSTPYANSTITLDGCTSRLNYTSQTDPARTADIYIAAANNGFRLRVRESYSTAIYSAGTFDYPTGSLLVQSSVANITTALQGHTYTNFQSTLCAYPDWELRRSGASAAWLVSPPGGLIRIDANGTPGSPAANTASYTGTLTSAQQYSYALASHHEDGRWTAATAEVDVTANSSGSTIVTASLQATPCQVVVWRKTGTGVLSSPDHFAVVPMNTAQAILIDTGANVNGIPWQSTSVPVPSSVASYNQSVECTIYTPGGPSICWGTGSPTVNAIPAAQGSQYYRKDGTTGTTAYSNDAGTTTWTAYA